MSRVTHDELMAALSAADREVDQANAQVDEDALLLERLNLLGAGGIEDLAEGERAAVAVEVRQRADGRAWGVGGPRQKALTASQVTFAQGLIEGKTLKQAYREAYPNTKAKDSTVAAAAHRLSKHPRIAAMVGQAWAESVEALTDDVQATRRYVIKMMLHMVQTAESESARLRALEGLGKASGAFTPAPVEQAKAVTPDQLRRELQGHLRLIQSTQRTGTGGRLHQGAGSVEDGGGSSPTVPAPPAVRE